MAYQQPSVEYADPRTYAADNDREASTRRGSTMPEQNRYAPPQKPIDEAVTKAVDRAGAQTASSVPPELIAQITQNVIKQLQTGGGLDGSTPVPPQTAFSPPPMSQNIFSPPPPSMHQPVPLSPSTASGTSPNMLNRVYTPPSPNKHSDYPRHTSPQLQSGYVPDDLPSPRHEKPAQFNPRRSSSPHSQASESSDKPYVRPKGPTRLSTSQQETTLEKIWGQLFDEDGHPTKRLGAFLRGLAVHIVCLIQ